MSLTYRVQGAGPIVVCHPGGPGFSFSYLQDLGGAGQFSHSGAVEPARDG